MKKAFTLIELLAAIIIVVIIGSLIFTGIKHSENSTDQFDPFFFPIEANAQANQQLAKEMAEQNRLLRELVEKKNNP